jgi:hypothetical protein
MSRERLFLGTAFIQALLNSYDEYHQLAKQHAETLESWSSTLTW